MLATQLTVAVRRRRLFWVGLGLLCALAGIVIFGSGPAAAYLLRERAKTRGFDLIANGVKVRWLAIECSQVLVHRKAPLLDARLNNVVFRVSIRGALDHLEVGSGNIEAQGALQAWRRALQSTPATPAHYEERMLPGVSVSNLKLQWKVDPHLTLTAELPTLEQDRAGKLTLIAAQARVQARLATATILGVSAEFLPLQGVRKLANVNVDSATFDLTEEKASAAQPAPSSASLPSVAPGIAPGVTPNVAPRNVAPPSVAPDVAPSVALRAELDALAARAEPLLTDTFRMSLHEFSVTAHFGKQAFSIGKEKASLARSADALTLRVEPAGELLPNSTPLRIELLLPFKSISPLHLSIEGGPITLKELGLVPGALGIERPERATLEASTEVALSAGGAQVSFSGKGALAQLSLVHPRLSAEPIQDLQLRLAAKGTLDVPSGLLTLEEGAIQLGQVRVIAKGSLQKKAEHLAIHGTLEVPLCACQTAKDSLPVGLIPALSGVGLSGTFAFSARVDADSRNLAKTAVSWELNNECHVDSILPELNPERFRRPFTQQVVGSHNEALFLETGPGTASWTSSAEIPEALITAALVSEDGNFFHHKGFDHRALQNSVRDNLQAGKFLRGGSTISMQLAKNLYLKREKTLSRKFQEAFFTMLLEQELSKDEILELYFNVIEFGPDVYGLRQAALYYFNTTPAQLSTAQAFFLVSILPNPKEVRFNSAGVLKPRWASYLRTLMRIAHERKRLSDAALEQGLAEELRFGKPE
ncbi:MAG: transglycosylase domain-containing protein [Polyangiaceae bacterium]|nr:transglycosylase domain-containing protein [Polyangiaceae bacterium]